MFQLSSRRPYNRPTLKKSLMLLQLVTAQTTSPPVDPDTGGGGT